MEDYTHGRIVSVDIAEEMKKSYIDYSMSVIVSRALPDVRDGLKPVHRRILYSMYEVDMTPDRAYKKSARLVGDVMGKYHPHRGCEGLSDASEGVLSRFSHPSYPFGQKCAPSQCERVSGAWKVL